MPNLDRDHYPDTFFVFVNDSLVGTWNNFHLTGQFCSAASGAAADEKLARAYDNNELDFLPFLPNASAFPFMSPFHVNVIANYRVEHDAEVARRVHAPEAPSRLSSVYAFGSYDQCEAVSAVHDWPLATVREFKLVDAPFTRVRRVNMEIVSLARGVYPLAGWGLDELDAIWRSYWGGFGPITVEIPVPPPTLREQVSSGCIWEYLIEGCIQKIEGSSGDPNAVR